MIFNIIGCNPWPWLRFARFGGSLVITLPKELVEAEGIEEGEIIQISVKKPRRSWFGAAKGVGPFTVRDELKAHE
ncbi:MAG: AbrB/MazE/SpoVT family DNA-binding domain-containing protein [Candidatus Bathyarchaeia archaeon]